MSPDHHPIFVMVMVSSAPVNWRDIAPPVQRDSTEIACPNPHRKCCEDNKLVFAADVFKEWVLLKGDCVLNPVRPVFLSCFGSQIHHVIVSGLP